MPFPPFNRRETGAGSITVGILDLFQLIEDAGAAAQAQSGTIHSCNICSVQEIDPLTKTREIEFAACVLKYRGSRVFEGASKGCALFQEMVSGLAHTLKARGYGEGCGSTLRFEPERWICELRMPDHVEFEFATAAWNSSKDQFPPLMPDFEPSPGYARYCLLADKDDPASGSVRARPFSHTFVSRGSKMWASSCVRTCEMLHATCQIQSCSFMPTRLLHIQEHSSGGQLFIRLKQMTASRMKADAREERYSTLTYCWGGVQDLKLDANTEGMLTRGIPASSLHKTLLDAILVTWDLGLRFIWIDCLCILQDSPLDVASEIAKLPEIYGNSFITISAARASHSREGFLQQTSLPAVSKPAFKLPFTCPDGRPGSVVLSSGLLNSPIDFRAWTLQEYVLSRRVLQFTQAGFHWTCSQTALFQEDEDALPLLFTQRLRRSYRMYTGIRGEDRTCRGWMNTVEEYTKRDLTYSADKLEAISGISELWGKASRDSYAAGIWVSHLPLGLLWTSAQPHLQPSLAEYRAPTWSWASLNGQIDWFDHALTKVDPSVKIVSCNVTPTYATAPYGKVSCGVLNVCGCLQETALEEEVSSTTSSSQADNEILDLELADTHLDLWHDALESRIQHCKLFCLQICSFEETSGRGPSGLILATEDGHMFRRVGVFFFEPPQDHHVKMLGNYEALANLAESILRIQRSAFQHVSPHTVTIV